jgi:SAM-dependent methyltransferase
MSALSRLWQRLMITYYTELEKAVGRSRSILDIGCGSNSPIQHLKRGFQYTVGIDGHKHSLYLSRKAGLHDDYICANLFDVDMLFRKKSFDCVILLDVIEHFKKEDGLIILQKLENIAQNRIIVFTPNGFQPQEEHSGNPYQKHLSGWSVSEFIGLGYRVIGINGWRPLLGQFALPRWKPFFFWTLISRITQTFVRNNPEYAFQLLCVKTINILI